MDTSLDTLAGMFLALGSVSFLCLRLALEVFACCRGQTSPACVVRAAASPGWEGRDGSGHDMGGAHG